MEGMTVDTAEKENSISFSFQNGGEQVEGEGGKMEGEEGIEEEEKTALNHIAIRWIIRIFIRIIYVKKKQDNTSA